MLLRKLVLSIVMLMLVVEPAYSQRGRGGNGGGGQRSGGSAQPRGGAPRGGSPGGGQPRMAPAPRMAPQPRAPQGYAVPRQTPVPRSYSSPNWSYPYYQRPFGYGFGYGFGLGYSYPYPYPYSSWLSPYWGRPVCTAGYYMNDIFGRPTIWVPGRCYYPNYYGY